jgi:hypothetical protein
MNRLQEPSTWAGFAALFQMLGALFPAYAAVAHAATMAAGAAAVALKEGNR